MWDLTPFFLPRFKQLNMDLCIFPNNLGTTPKTSRIWVLPVMFSLFCTVDLTCFFSERRCRHLDDCSGDPASRITFFSVRRVLGFSRGKVGQTNGGRAASRAIFRAQAVWGPRGKSDPNQNVAKKRIGRTD
jgi:hypothetical protein